MQCACEPVFGHLVRRVAGTGQRAAYTDKVDVIDFGAFAVEVYLPARKKVADLGRVAVAGHSQDVRVVKPDGVENVFCVNPVAEMRQIAGDYNQISGEEVIAQPWVIGREYRERLAAWTEALRRACGELRIEFVEITNKTPFDRALLRFLEKRSRLH